MNVIEITRELGKALQEDPRYSMYYAAKLANDKDEELQNKINEFHATKMKLDIEMAKSDKDTAAISTLNSELNSLYMTVSENPNMIAFEAAKAEMDDLLQSINYIIVAAANGQDPMTCPEKAPETGCSGSCSSCAGCH